MNRVFIEKLTKLVETNMANESFGPEELAKEAGMSQSNLNRKLKSINNQTISQFIREIRLKKAKELLHNEDLTVAEISYRVGFGSPTYFNNCFHEYFGVTPGEMKIHEPEVEPIEQPVETSAKKSKSSKILMGLVVSIIVLLPLAYFVVNKYHVFKTVDAKEKSIAVLPFINLSNDTLNQYQANAMMDAILMNLSKIKDLRVISRTSVEQYRGSDKTITEIGRELDAAYLLEGSFQKVDNRIRLIIQLIRAKNEDHVWSNNYDRNWEDIFEVQSEVAETVASELQAAITPEEKQLIRKVPTLNLTAYDFCQRGREKLNSMWGDFGGYIKTASEAERLFLKALELDSTFALAYSGLATAYYAKNRLNNILAENFLDSVLIFANKALSFDPQLADAIMNRGDYFLETGRPDLAMEEYYKALKLNPNDWLVYWNLGSVTHELYNDFTGSISNLHEAILRNKGPELPFLLGAIGAAYEHAGFIDKAMQCYKQRFELNNDTSVYSNSKFWLLYEVGNYEQAFIEDKNTGQKNPLWGGNLLLSILSGHDKESYIYALNAIEWAKKYNINPINDAHRIGYGLWVGGKQKEAEPYFQQQIEQDLNIIKAARLGSSMKTAHYDLAATYAMIGEKDKAYFYLDEFNKKNSFPLWWVNLIKQDPLFDNIRNETRFQKIIKDVEAKYQAEHDRVEKWLKEQEIL